MLTISVVDQRWQDLYRAAIFEPNSQEVPKRIADAERALVLRARELFGSKEDNIEEEQALDDAMYALNALRNAWAHRGKAASVTHEYSMSQSA